MTLNNFEDILNLTKKRCNISDVTDFDDIVSTAINGAYIELKKKEPNIKSAYIPGINGVVNLPEDIDSIISIEPPLYADEYRLGNSIVLKRESSDVFKIIYSAVADMLDSQDIPEINKKYWYAMSTYGCYAYYNYKKKHNEASAYMQEYLSQVDKAESNDMLQGQIQNVYSSVLSGVGAWQGF